MGTATFGYSDKKLQTERLLDHGGYDDKGLPWSVDIKKIQFIFFDFTRK